MFGRVDVNHSSVEPKASTKSVIDDTVFIFSMSDQLKTGFVFLEIHSLLLLCMCCRIQTIKEEVDEEMLLRDAVLL